MNITYSQNGDYRIPNIVIRKTKPIGHYLEPDETELRELTDSALEKLRELSDADYEQLELIPDFMD